MLDRLLTVEPDKLFALAVSACALILSMIFSIYSFRKQHYDRERSIREQLGKIIEGLVDAYGENIKLSVDRANLEEAEYMERWQVLHQTIDSQTRRATYLVSRYPEYVTDVDYAILARSFHLISSWQLATQSWQSAVARSKEAGFPYYEMLNLRGYADFLCSRGRIEEARLTWQSALNCLCEDDDDTRYQNGFTYQLWMMCESNDPERANACFQNSHKCFSAIGNTSLRETSLNALEQAAHAMRDATVAT